MAAARVSSCCWVTDCVMTSVTCGLPSVKVPVLSNATILIEPICSNAAPPFINTPCLAALDRADVITAGVDITNAQGQPINNKVNPR